MGFFKFLFYRKKDTSPLASRKYGEQKSEKPKDKSVLASKKYGKEAEEELPTFARVDFSKRPAELEEQLANDTYEFPERPIATRGDLIERYNKVKQETEEYRKNKEKDEDLTK